MGRYPPGDRSIYVKKYSAKKKFCGTPKILRLMVHFSCFFGWRRGLRPGEGPTTPSPQNFLFFILEVCYKTKSRRCRHHWETSFGGSEQSRKYLQSPHFAATLKTRRGSQFSMDLHEIKIPRNGKVSSR